MEEGKPHAWVNEFPGAVTVCDRDGIILAMNAKSMRAYQKPGESLLGSNLLDCHPEPSRTHVQKMLASGQSNVYTVEKSGVRKLVYQSPWYLEGEYRGFVELVLELPESMPHFVRGGE